MTLLAFGLLPRAASATTFSFGTINPGDVIASLIFVTGTNKVTFDPGTNIMHVEGYVSTINFSSRAVGTDPLTIGGGSLPVDAVLFTSDIMLVGGSFGVTESSASNPRSLVAGFMNGAVQDLSIFDTVNAITLLEADYVGNLAFSATETGSVSFPLPVNGELSGNLSVLPLFSDPDFVGAFGPFGLLDANFSSFFSDGASVASNLCNLVKAGVGTYGSQVCAGGYALDDFAVNTNMTIIPTAIPEPGSALLLGLGLAGVAALRRK